VIRPQTEELHDYRGYAGKIISGVYKKGDRVTIQPSGYETTVSGIEIGGIEVEEAYAPQSAIMHIEDDIDVSRGDVIVHSNNISPVSNELEVLICWMGSNALERGNKYLLQINSKVVKAIVKEISYKIDVNTLEKIESTGKVLLNEIVKATIKTASPIVFDSYKKLRVNGGAILIDETSNVTVGACMIQ
jgi:sulfate adenylyltransferase subunit 1